MAIQQTTGLRNLNSLIVDGNPNDIFISNTLNYRLGTGGAIFRWDWESTEDEVLNTIWKYKNRPQGRFVRLDSYNMNPFLLGAVAKDIDDAKTLGSMGFTEEELNYFWRPVVPEVTLTDTPDWVALQYAVRMIPKGWRNINLQGKVYVVSKDVILPSETQGYFGYENMIEEGVQLINFFTRQLAYFKFEDE